ncbi:carbon storage regulator [Gimesia fumaroli]|uniref:Carbon storage regulator n=1 Tax=Gimesia fumaroli TaxID=2527976 RepID=A0A518I909_9PLAN|nr:carbon storage regulator [Gimesia fumaroli]QDV49596.1 carbon storage regulator [Gimesia fumaroli]
MLVLTRRTNESVTITDRETGKQLTLKMLECKNGRSRIGFDGPRDFQISRDQVENTESLAEMPTGG